MKMYALELNHENHIETIELYHLEGPALDAGNQMKKSGKLEGVLSLMRVNVDQFGNYQRKDALFITAWI